MSFFDFTHLHTHTYIYMHTDHIDLHLVKHHTYTKTFIVSHIGLYAQTTSRALT